MLLPTPILAALEDRIEYRSTPGRPHESILHRESLRYRIRCRQPPERRSSKIRQQVVRYSLEALLVLFSELIQPCLASFLGSCDFLQQETEGLSDDDKVFSERGYHCQRLFKPFRAHYTTFTK